MKVIFLKLSAVLLILSGCAKDRGLEPPSEFYYFARRQAPPAPVYSRLMWTYPPSPIPQGARGEDVPLLSPKFSFDMMNVTLDEAVSGLGTATGYRWEVPARLASRRVSVKFVGTVDEILRRITEQAGAVGAIDQRTRMIRVMEPPVFPRLGGGEPGYGTPQLGPTHRGDGAASGGISS